MSTGILRIQTYTSRQASALPGVTVTVTGDGFTQNFVTDQEGNAPDLEIQAPDPALSLDPTNTTRQPYSLVNITAAREGWQSVTLKGVQIFGGQTTLAPLELAPIGLGRMASDPMLVEIPPHPLFSGQGGSGVAPATEDLDRILTQVVIPKTITVHLGAPSASASNVTVSFVTYIATVASGEIYPTWPEQALRANILAQISLALNRIYTEWYLSKGYSFDITGSPSYDQIYTHGRTIFESVKKIAEEIFNTYVRKTGTFNPYFTEYCDGKTVTCKGMSQWGTVTKANQGLSALQILKSYYGNDLELITTQNIAGIPRSYPGSPLRVGSSGTDVAIIQRQLNRIAQDYPFFGTLTADGYFGASTAEVVKKFQKQFNLTADGVVGKSTWYKISYIYVSVKDLAELTSEGERTEGSISGGEWGGTVLQSGNRGSAVEQVQFWLKELSLYDSSLSVNVDGIYGPSTERAVRAYQQLRGLAVDGKVGRLTWEALYADYLSAQSDTTGRLPTQYPGSPIQEGDRGANVQLVQFYLRMAATMYTSLPTPSVDGIFGPSTRSAVIAFQKYFGLSADGVVGRATWNKLTEVYLGVTNSLLSPSLRPGDYPGLLKQGSTGTAVRELQYYLVILHAFYNSLPAVTIDGIFGPATARAVDAWQRMQGLTVDGIVGPATWKSIYSSASVLRTSGPVVTVKQRPYPGSPVGEGASGADVDYISRLLELVAFYYPDVQSFGITHAFGSNLAISVKSFQTRFGLPVTGKVDELTWFSLEAVAADLVARGGVEDDGTGYPGYALSLGSMGYPVYLVQQWLNRLADLEYFYRYVPQDGNFDETTRDAVLLFQLLNGLSETGVVDQTTWDTLRQAVR